MADFSRITRASSHWCGRPRAAKKAASAASTAGLSSAARSVAAEATKQLRQPRLDGSLKPQWKRAWTPGPCGPKACMGRGQDGAVGPGVDRHDGRSRPGGLGGQAQAPAQARTQEAQGQRCGLRQDQAGRLQRFLAGQA